MIIQERRRRIILTMTVGISQPPTPAPSETRRTGDASSSFSMRVSSKAHYGLRMMTEFARAYGRGPLSIAEVARIEHLPLAYLEQLAGQLRRGGLVESTRGVHGGYALARPPEKISVLEVVHAVEGEVSPVECVASDYVSGSCAREGECASRGLWQRLKESIDAVLRQTTLAELIHDQSLLAAIAPADPHPVTPHD
jgi:Rrf2 family cysteine metabolism transcriptional repressor